MDSVSAPGAQRLSPQYDDILDVLKSLLRAVPVDEHWYKAQYPGVADFIARTPTETPSTHYQKHGYFERRRPFAPGWRGISDPVPFTEIQSRLRVVPARGRLLVDISRDEMLAIANDILRAVPVDETWYRVTYPKAAADVDQGRLASVTDHYITAGFSSGYLPSDPTVNEAWYVSRYDHVRNGIERGLAKTPKQHFIRIGYREGCRPTPP
jgi:hypothetical protein